MTSNKIFIALTDSYLGRIIPHVEKGDIIITDLYCPCHKGKTINPELNSTEQKELSISTQKVFNYHFSRDGNESIEYGYVNNFYECTIYPIVKYISTLRRLLGGSKSDYLCCMEKRTLLNPLTSTYFMAEHESSGMHLYDRNSALGPYISKYLLSINAEISYQSMQISHQVFYLNILRTTGVFLARFFIDLRSTLSRDEGQYRDKELHDFLKNEKFRNVFIIRTEGQLNKVLPYFLSTKMNTLIVISTSFSRGVNVDLLRRELKGKANIFILQSRRPTLRLILSSYFSSFSDLVALKSTKHTFHKTNVNITQSLREVHVMSANLKVYYNQVFDMLEGVSIDNNGFVFSLEQKSPHAKVDSNIAKNLGLKSAQIKQCNQLYRILPDPVFSDAFLCDTPEAMINFRNVWHGCAEKVHYAGTFNSVNQKSHETKSDRKTPLRLCVFLGVHKNVNINTLRIIEKFQSKMSVILHVKLHPRDFNSYDKVISGAVFEVGTQPNRLFKQFDLAVTYPSGVVNDLLFSRLPFIIFKPNHSDYANFIYDDSLEKIVQIESDKCLLDKLFKHDEIIRKHSDALEYFYKKSGVIQDINKVEGRLLTIRRNMQ